MQNLHHKPLKRFGLSGNIYTDSAIGRLRLEYVNLVKTEMALSGYVPRLDIDIDFTIGYNFDKHCYEFELSLYGVFVGKRKAEWIDGIDGTLVVPTQKSKSRESLSEAA
jgi:hypothetical protein